ncbi:hypothetical protein D3C78_1001050 [compost metagenome]
MRLFLRKVQGGTLVADNDEAVEWLQKVKNGDVVAAEVTRPRNYLFHKRYFALLNLGFDAWEPALPNHNGFPVVKNFERFRKDVAIASGFYELTVNIKGETRAEAKSISFANMSEEEFNRLFQQTITMFLSKYQILCNYKDSAEVEDVVNKILGFA